MKTIRLVGLIVTAYILSGVAAAPASAACGIVAVGEQSSYREGTCQPQEAEGGWAKVNLFQGKEIGGGLACVKVQDTQPSAWTENECKNPKNGTSEQIKIRTLQYNLAPGTPPRLMTFKGSISKLTNAGSGIVIKCTANSGAGEIVGQAKIKSVTLAFKGCTATEKGTSCGEVKSTGVGKEEIKTVKLRGTLGTANPLEASSEVVQDWIPTSGTEFMSLNDGGTCKFFPAKVTGSVIGEIPTDSLNKPQTKVKLLYEETGELQTITKINGNKESLSVAPPCSSNCEVALKVGEEMEFEKAVEMEV